MQYNRTVRSLWTWLWGRYHVSQNVFLVQHEIHAFGVTRISMINLLSRIERRN